MSKIERFLSDPRYQALDDAGKKEKLDLFFNKYVTQDARYAPLDEEGKARVYSKFMSKYYGEPEAKAPKQKTRFSELRLKSELKGTMSLTQSAEAISTGLAETQALDRRNKAYQKVMADREEALRIIDRERNLKQAIPQDRVAAGQQFKSRYTEAMERLQPNNYTDPIERQVAHEIVNKEKLDKAQREYQRIAERMASATPEERKEIAKSLAAQQTLIDYYATGMTAAERAAYQAGQEDSESFRMVKALGAGTIDLASSVYQLFNPDSKFARTINAYSAGLLEQSGNPLEDAFAQVFYSMPMTLGYFMTSGILGTVGTATKAASIATKAGEVASLMHSVNINAYMTAKKYSDAISGYGSATAVPEGVFLAGSTAALVESSIEMLSDTAQAKIVLGQAKRIGRRGAEQIIKNSLRGKIAGYGIRLATGMAESAITEFTEEILQGASGMIFDVMSNQREVPSLEEAFKELMYSGAVGALGGITFGLGGGIMVQSSNYQNWREVKKQAASGNEHAARLWEARSILDKSNPNGEIWKSDVQRAYDVIKSDLHAVTENRYQEDNPSIAQAMAQMYDAYAMFDMIKSPQQEAVREAMQAGVQRILDQKRATAIQEPTQKAAATEPQSVENTIIKLLQEGDIEAAESTLNESIKNRVTGINIPYLRTLVNESKAVAARTAKEAAAQKERQDIIDKYGKYAYMSHSELQDEAKKRGLKAGGKSTDIMARLKESDQAKPKAETTPAKPAAKKPFATNEPTEQQQDRAIKESLIAEETPKKASKYESMGYNALQKEAKKRGINSFGVKKAELIRQLEEKAAGTEKTKAERAKSDQSSQDTTPVKAAEDSKIDKLYNRINTTVAGKDSQDMYVLKRDLGLLLMPKVRVQEAESVADYYIALREGSVTQAEYDNYIDELIAENRVNDTSDAEKVAARERVDAYRNKKAEDSKPKQQSPKDDGYIRINIGDLIEHYKAMGMDRQRAWKEYIQDTVLSKRVITDSIDAKDFMPYFDRIQFPQKSDKMMPAPVKAEGVEADASVERAKPDTKPEHPKPEAKAPKPQSYTEDNLRTMGFDQIENYKETVGFGKYKGKIWRTAEYEALNDRGEIHKYEVKVDNDGIAKVKDKGKTKQQIEIEDAAQYKENPEQIRAWIDQNLPNINDYLKNKIAEFMLGGKKGDKKKLDYIALSTVFTPNTRERLSEFSNLITKLEIASMLKQIGDRVLSAEDIGSEVAPKIQSVPMSRSNFQEQYRQAQEGKLPKEQIDAQLKLYDAMMDTYAKEMGITIDEAYAEVIDSVTADEPVDGTARRSGARYQTVEEKNLVTIHNIPVDSIEKVNNRGGMVMPSIAIIDATKTKFTGFGDASLIGDEKMIQPSAKQPLYTSDAYTPTYPKVYEIVKMDKNLEALAEYLSKKTKKKVTTWDLEANIEDQGSERYVASLLYGVMDYKKAQKEAIRTLEQYPINIEEKLFAGYTASGKRRYIPHTAENALRIMRKDSKDQPNTFWGTSSLRGALAAKFSSLAQAKKNRDMILSEAEMKPIEAATEEMFLDIAERANAVRKHQELFYHRNIAGDIYDMAKYGWGRIADLYKDDSIKEDFRSFISHLRSLPTQYFEYKPQRVVGINEFVAAVIPTGTKASTAKALRDAGLKVVRYEAGNDEARFEAVKRVSEEMGVRYQTIQGYIQKMPNGKYRIGIMQPNVTTGLHEQAHLGKSLMEIMANKSPAWASRLKAAEEWCGVKDGKWTTEAEEKFANGYVKFLADGSAPNGKLKTIFAKIKEWIGSILQGLADVKNLDVSNEMRGVYLSMLGISEGKRNLTSEQKVLSIKLKSAMKQAATSDPLKLETEIDRFADSNDLILEGKRTGNKTSFYLNRIDDGKTMIEIHHSNGEYDVNGYHAANNQEVMEQVTRILGETRYQTTDMPSAAEIAEAERQMAEVRAKYEGTDQWMKAPNGKPTKLNERQWLQVRTENFKKWFGDWENDPKNASKVVDENGEPRPVWHGTASGGFTVFSRDELGKNTQSKSAKKGFFFAGKESTSAASGYLGEYVTDTSDVLSEATEIIENIAYPATSLLSNAGVDGYSDGYREDLSDRIREFAYTYSGRHTKFYNAILSDIDNIKSDIETYREEILSTGATNKDIDAAISELNGARDNLDGIRTDFMFGNDMESMYSVFLNVRDPLEYNYAGERRRYTFAELLDVAIDNKKDGAIFSNVEDGGPVDDVFVVFSPTQIKSATANVGTFDPQNPDIRYQIDNAIQSASPDMQERIAKIMEKQKKVQQAANATYRELTTKIGRTTSVYEWDSLMRKSLVTAIRNAFPGAAPMNIEKYAALEETLGELDPGLEDHAKEIKRIKAQLRRMVAMDMKFRDALEDVSGFSDIADIPFEGLFSALENTNPAAYDRYFKDETFDILLKALPKIKTAYDGQFTMQTLQRIVDVILSGNDPNVGRDVSELAFLQPQRLFAELFGKAGINTINYAYHGTLKLAAYEMEYTPHLREINRLLMTADNNRGSAYDGDDLDIIGRTIFEVDGNSEISNKLETIQERLAEWAEENNAVINSKDVEDIYNEKEYLKDIMRGFIAEWNANPERTQKIGIREDYDNPRKYNWGDISDITTKGGKYLYTPGNARERSKQDFSDGLDYDTNIFNAYSNYMYSMTRYMAFYDLANYVEGSSILYASKGGKAGQKKMASGFDLDLSLAQHKSSAYASKMIEDYVRNTIGYHKKDTPKGRLLASARTNVYASLLAANVIMTVLNYNQRNLIHSVVDQNIAKQVKTDVAFWTGLFKPSNEEYPTLSGIMQAYVTANQSLIAELAAEAKRSANQGRTALTRAYYKHSAYNAELLRLSPFSLAELGNRAYAHAAGVYQVTQNSMAYKEYVASGMSRHQAMERALSEDSNLRRAAITYGGIINAEVNADTNRAFSPHFFGDATNIKKIAIFLRYGVTIALLELRTYGGARDIKSLLSPDLFRLLTSGNVKAATAAQTIQAGAIMKSMLHPKRIAELVRRGQVSTAKTSKNLITVNEVNMVRDAITWALDEQAKHTEEEFHNIIRGKSGAKRAMAALMAFSVSEVLLRSLLELLFSLIPWWQGKKKFIETDVIENIASVLGLFQGLKTASNVRLGATLAPDLGAYNPTAKTTTKALSQYVLRLTPYAGLANYMGKVFTGKYFSDLFWDEVYD